MELNLLNKSLYNFLNDVQIGNCIIEDSEENTMVLSREEFIATYEVIHKDYLYNAILDRIKIIRPKLIKNEESTNTLSDSLFKFIISYIDTNMSYSFSNSVGCLAPVLHENLIKLVDEKIIEFSV